MGHQAGNISTEQWGLLEGYWWGWLECLAQKTVMRYGRLTWPQTQPSRTGDRSVGNGTGLSRPGSFQTFYSSLCLPGSGLPGHPADSVMWPAVLVLGSLILCPCLVTYRPTYCFSTAPFDNSFERPHDHFFLVNPQAPFKTKLCCGLLGKASLTVPGRPTAPLRQAQNS